MLRQATVGVSGQGWLLLSTCSRLASRLERTAQVGFIFPRPRARRHHGRAPLPGAQAVSTLASPIRPSGPLQHRQTISSSTRSWSSKPGRESATSAALLSRLQARLEEWHLASASSMSHHSAAEDVTAEERQEHLEIARMELKWMMDEVSASTSQSGTGQGDVGGMGALEIRLEEMVRRRVEEHEPLAYILGTQPFGSLDLLTRPPTLIPRPETEDWASRLIGQIHSTLPAGGTSQRPLRILDLCTGTGCIGLSLAAALGNKAQVTCADVVEEALQLVRENLLRNGLTERASHDEKGAGVRLAQVDLFSSRAQLARGLYLEQGDASSSSSSSSSSSNSSNSSGGKVSDSGTGYDVLVCNPPYIPRAEYETLQPSVRLWEDRRALLGEYDGSGETEEKEGGGSREERAGPEQDQEDGLAFYRRLADVLDTLLPVPGAPAQQPAAPQRNHKEEDELAGRAPVLALEVGKGQAAAVEDILRASVSGQSMDFERWKDPWQVERVVVGYWRLR